ncbi:MAG: RAQPRD family integrative conjugative element protein [Gammaproteobacteria bacterium]|jgi:RAQPRD family integrative conjugative element protein
MQRQLWLPSFLIIGSLITQGVFADADAERDALVRIIHELKALELLIKQAEANADQDARVRFRYDWLRQDLKQIRDGVQLHINAPRAQPRSFPPLRGDYRR